MWLYTHTHTHTGDLLENKNKINERDIGINASNFDVQLNKKLYDEIKSDVVGVGVPDDPKIIQKHTNNLKSNVPTSNSAITLVALVITIIVLLIIAGVTLAMVMGDSGIFGKASNAKENTQIETAKEIIKTQVLENELYKKTNDSEAKTDEELLAPVKEKLIQEGYTINEDDTITIGERTINIPEEIANVSSGSTTQKPTEPVISTETSCVGYYADIDGDGTVDGVIYADLAQGNTKGEQWANYVGKYSIPKITSNLRKYYISQESYEGDFESNPVVTATGTGGTTNRFYVMALSNIDENTYTWYKNAYGNINDYSTTTSEDFGKGKDNTTTIMKKWKTNEYGEQTLTDLWGRIQTEVEKGWFVPSRAEWSAFANELGIDKFNYNSDYKLKDSYWSSSLSYTTKAWSARFGNYSMDTYGVDDFYFNVRLSTRF